MTAGRGAGVLAIDAGSERSAYVFLVGGQVHTARILENQTVLELARAWSDAWPDCDIDRIVIEDIEPRQQPLGREVADTLRWIGRFMEAARPLPVHLVTRRAVTAHHVDGGTKDADKRIRAALIDRYGPGSERKGGPLAGIVKDMWSALAIATYWADTHGDGA